MDNGPVHSGLLSYLIRFKHLVIIENKNYIFFEKQFNNC